MQYYGQTCFFHYDILNCYCFIISPGLINSMLTVVLLNNRPFWTSNICLDMYRGQLWFAISHLPFQYQILSHSMALPWPKFWNLALPLKRITDWCWELMNSTRWHAQWPGLYMVMWPLSSLGVFTLPLCVCVAGSVVLSAESCGAYLESYGWWGGLKVVCLEW